MPTRALTEDIDAIFSLLSTAAHSGVDQYGIQDTKDNDDDDDDAVTDDINEPDSLSSTQKDYVDDNLSDEQVEYPMEDMAGAWEKQMYLMVDYSKPKFTKIWRRFPNLGQLIQI